MEPTESDRPFSKLIGNFSDRAFLGQMPGHKTQILNLLAGLLLKVAIEPSIGAVQPAGGFTDQQQNIGRLPIPTGATNFLHIFRRDQRPMPMNNPAHIRAIDPHAKGAGADQKGQLTPHPLSFQPAAIGRWQPGMIGGCLVAPIAQILGQVFAGLAAAGKNQAPLAGAIA